MRNWLIELLGGYTKQQVEDMKDYYQAALKNAKKNDYRDKRGRFTKAPKK